ncbi:MobA-like NTP transferase domain-containing protein [bacterium A37T11]|nr:MobA-like NTP transferase domain-containing protein [bacterium A37T11]
MVYAIIAAGEGSRLAGEGIRSPKPMVPLNGEPMIDRLIGIFSRNQATHIYVIINEFSPLLKQHLETQVYPVPLTLVCKNTSSSLHSFYELLKAMPEVGECCLTTTDTVFTEPEFKAYVHEFEKRKDLDGLMAVTTFKDDESPLYVVVDHEHQVLAFTDNQSIETPFVSGGVYCLRSRALKTVEKAIRQGNSRMRNFQRQLIKERLLIKAYPFSKIVDVDHAQDIQTAELFLREIS